MTVLSLLQEASPFLGLDVPSLVYASTDRTMVELKAVTNDMAEKIAKAHPWQLFSTVATVTGDGSDEDFDLAADFDWMPDGNQVWSSTLNRPLSHVVAQDQWLGMDVQDFDMVVNAWIIYGGQIHIKPALANLATAQYFYQSNLIIDPASGTNKVAFTLDTDTYRLSERLLKLGVLYRWKQLKGQPYSEEMNDFEDLKEKLISRDKGATILRQGSARMPRGVNVAFPGNVPGGV